MIHALHGNLGAASDWAAVPFSDPVVTPDLWAWQERFPALSLEAFGLRWADDVAALDAAPVLLGYSLGGRLGLQALAARPSLWRGAIFVSTHPGLVSAEEREARRAHDAVWARRAREESWDAFLADWNAQSVLANQAVPASQPALEPRREAIAGGFESWSLGCQLPMEGVLARSACPIWWVVGERDALYRALARRVAEAAPTVRVVVVPGAGHRLVWERPDALAEIAAEALGQMG